MLMNAIRGLKGIGGGIRTAANTTVGRGAITGAMRGSVLGGAIGGVGSIFNEDQSFLGGVAGGAAIGALGGAAVGGFLTARQRGNVFSKMSPFDGSSLSANRAIMPIRSNRSAIKVNKDNLGGQRYNNPYMGSVDSYSKTELGVINAMPTRSK